MKLTRKQLRKLILEGYRELHRQQSRAYKRGEIPYIDPISISPSKRYYKDLRAGLYQRGIDSQRNTGFTLYDYSLSNDHELEVGRSISWPHGFTVARDSLFAAIPAGQSGIVSIRFAVSGNPDVDAEFIARLCTLSDDDFLRIGAKTIGSARVGSWESEIIPGYPHEFIGL